METMCGGNYVNNHYISEMEVAMLKEMIINLLLICLGIIIGYYWAWQALGGKIVK